VLVEVARVKEVRGRLVSDGRLVSEGKLVEEAGSRAGALEDW